MTWTAGYIPRRFSCIKKVLTWVTERLHLLNDCFTSKAGDTRVNTVGRQCWLTILSADNVGSCVTAADKRKIFDERNAFSFDGWQCWLVCCGSRQCRLTNQTFNFYLLVVFCRFLRKASGILSWNFPHLSLGVVLSSHGSNVIDFACTIFASKHVNAMISHKNISISINISHCINGSSKSRFFAKILRYFFIFVPNKKRRND